MAELWRTRSYLVSLAVGCCLFPIAWLISAVAIASGDGSYLLSKILFPYAALLKECFGLSGCLGFVVVVLQYPLYGAVAGMILHRKWWVGLVGIVPLVHLVAVSQLYRLGALYW